MLQVMGHLAYVLVELRASGLRIIRRMLSRSTERHRTLGEVVYDGSSEGGILERIIVVRETGRVHGGCEAPLNDVVLCLEPQSELRRTPGNRDFCAGPP